MYSARQRYASLANISNGQLSEWQADTGKDVSYDAVGAKKYRRLRRLAKARFDPSGLFRLNQNIEQAPIIVALR